MLRRLDLLKEHLPSDFSMARSAFTSGFMAVGQPLRAASVSIVGEPLRQLVRPYSLAALRLAGIGFFADLVAEEEEGTDRVSLSGQGSSV
jgi:hypothetical protein